VNTRDADKTIRWDDIGNVTLPASEEAQALDGSYCGFQPKPAVEIVLVAMKPLSEKTYIDQAMKNGKGITWLAAGQIPTASDVESKNGRFPANLLVSDDALNDGRTRKSGGVPDSPRSNTMWNGYSPERQKRPGDSGSYSRYFSLDAWWEERIKLLPEGVQKTFPFMVVAKPTKKEKCAGLEGMPKKQMYKCDNSANSLELIGTTDGGRQPRENYHPTCKPIKLMSYLIAIGSRPGDLVLDPFVGSGTTAIAAKLMGRSFIAMEIQDDYWEIARKRLDHVKELIV
jgi:site-specific DNA-methyltransferase (adenine-specific)